MGKESVAKETGNWELETGAGHRLPAVSKPMAMPYRNIP